MHLPALITDLATILAVATLFGFIFLHFRQPVVLGYLVAGLVVGPHTPPFMLVTDIPNVKTLAELGVIFLMFSVGLEFSFSRLKTVGAKVVVGGVIETSLMFAAGALVAKFLGFSNMEMLFFGGVLAISSTTIIAKAVADLNLKGKRFVESVFGLLIVEDLIAVLLLVFLSIISQGNTQGAAEMISAGGKLLLVIGTWILVGSFLVPKIVTRLTWLGGQEMLTLLSFGLCLALVAISARFEYSPALGAFIMGSLLSETGQVHKIERIVTPFRDLFVAIFFVSIGMLIDPNVMVAKWDQVLALSVLVIGGKLIAVFVAMLIGGESPKNATRAAFSLTQIGEFAFIIVTLGLNQDVLSAEVFPVVVAVSVFTTFLTPHFMRLGLAVSQKVEKVSFFIRAHEQLERVRDVVSADALNTESLKKFFVQWLSCGISVTVLTAFFGQYVLPRAAVAFPQMQNIEYLMLLASFLVSAPLIWGMFSALKLRDASRVFQSTRPAFAFLFFVRAATLIWLGLLTNIFIPDFWSLVITVICFGLVVALSYRRLQLAYDWVERKFVTTLEDTKTKRDPNVSHLAPWDAFLSRFEVANLSPIAGKSLIELGLREKYGINIVAIQRGRTAIVAPRPHERILPLDEVLVLGTDENLTQFAALTSETRQEGEEDSGVDINYYALHQLKIESGCRLEGVTIRSSGIREKHRCMVVGLERGDERIMNPSSDLQFKAGDVVWFVGAAAGIREVEELTCSEPMSSII